MTPATNSRVRALASALVLTSLVLAGCGGDEKAAPEKAPAAQPPATQPEKAVNKPVVPVKPVVPAKPAAETVEKPTAKPAPEASDVEKVVERVAEEIGVDLPEGAAGAVEDALEDERVKEVVKDLTGKDGLDVDSVKDDVTKRLGIGGDDEDAAKKKADGVAKAAGDSELAGLSTERLRKKRGKEVEKLQAEQETALTQLRADFAKKIADKPDKKAKLEQRLTEKEGELAATYEKKIKAVRARYKAAIDAQKQ